MSDSGVQKIHMLVVEDDEGQCLLVERMLREINRRSQLLYITMKSVGRVSAALKEQKTLLLQKMDGHAQRTTTC